MDREFSDKKENIVFRFNIYLNFILFSIEKNKENTEKTPIKNIILFFCFSYKNI